MPVDLSLGFGWLKLRTLEEGQRCLSPGEGYRKTEVTEEELVYKTLSVAHRLLNTDNPLFEQFKSPSNKVLTKFTQ